MRPHDDDDEVEEGNEGEEDTTGAGARLREFRVFLRMSGRSVTSMSTPISKYFL